jgi:hypothetical protein
MKPSGATKAPERCMLRVENMAIDAVSFIVRRVEREGCDERVSR